MRLDAEGKTLGLLQEFHSRASLRRAASASKNTYEKLEKVMHVMMMMDLIFRLPPLPLLSLPLWHDGATHFASLQHASSSVAIAAADACRPIAAGRAVDYNHCVRGVTSGLQRRLDNPLRAWDMMTTSGWKWDDRASPLQRRESAAFAAFDASLRRNASKKKKTTTKKEEREPTTSTIPRRLHLIWLGRARFPSQEVVDRWAALHPTWSIHVWRDADFDRVVTFSARFLHLRDVRVRSDVLRLELLYRYGGVYIDDDVVPLRALDALVEAVERQAAAAGRESNNNNAACPTFAALEDESVVNNAVIGAPQRAVSFV